MINFSKFNLYNYLSESSDIKQIIDLKKIKKLDLSKNFTNSTNKFVFSLINLKIFLKNFSL